MIQKCVSTFTKVGEKIITRLRYNCDKHCIPSRYYSYETLNKDHWSILFFGTDEFALSSLQALHDSCREKKLRRLEIVTAYKGEENDVIKYAKDHDIFIHNWPPQIQKNEFEIGVVVSFGHMIPSRIIELFPLGMINVHGSLLPRWRGAAPICHALMNGDTQTGVSIMKIMPKRFDIGSIIAQRAIEIQPEDTYIELYSKLAELGSGLLMEVISELPDVLNSAKAQTEDGVTYAPKITKEMSYIKWNKMTAKDVYNLQRALNGIQPLRSHFGNETIKLENVKEVPVDTEINCPQRKVPGLVVFDKRKKQLYIACQGNSWITVGTIIIPNRRPQSPADFGSGFIQNRKEKSCLFY